MTAPALPYRPCVGIMVVDSRGLVWVGRRADMPGEAEGDGQWWQMPQGGIDEGEDPMAAARREVSEETGMRSLVPLGQTSGWLTYDLPPELIGVAWGGRFRGQRQKWYAMRFTGEDSEISIVPPAGHNVEFIDWRWAPVDELLDLIVPFKRGVYEIVVADFAKLAVPA